MFENLLNPILNPFLASVHPLIFTISISLLISLIITIIYKLMTDQNLMKQLKAEMKEFQKEMKELKDHPEKMMSVQKKAMETNMKYMAKSMKPTLVTFIPIIIIFGWMHAHLAFLPILPGQEFVTTVEFKDYTGTAELTVPEGLELISDSAQQTIQNKASWTLKGAPGEYLMEYSFDEGTYTREVLISNSPAYKEPIKPIQNSNLKSININNEKLKVMNLFGWKVGWLGTYILCSLFFSMFLRKVMKLA